MHREKILIGYNTDLDKGIMFAKYRKVIIEDDGSITEEGVHIETITQETYDDLKRLEFANTPELEAVKAMNTKALELQEEKAKAIALKSELDTEKAKALQLEEELAIEKARAARIEKDLADLEKSSGKEG